MFERSEFIALNLSSSHLSGTINQWHYEQEILRDIRSLKLSSPRRRGSMLSMIKMPHQE